MYRKLRYDLNVLPFVAILLLVVAVMYFYIDKNIKPYVNEVCIDQAEYAALTSINQAIMEDMSANADNYKDIAIIKQSDSSEVVAVATDTYKINIIKSNIMEICERYMTENLEETIYVSLGSVFENSLFFTRGIDVPVKMIPLSTIKVDFASSFESTGINQTIHKIIVEVSAEMKIMTPYDTFDFTSTYKVPISETILVGQVPESYTYINIQ